MKLQLFEGWFQLNQGASRSLTILVHRNTNTNAQIADI